MHQMSEEKKRKSINIIDETKKPAVTIAMLAWPILLEQLLTSLVGYVDQAMVGAMGRNYTAAISISNPVINMINGIIMALGVGFTAHISRAIGAKDIERAKHLMRQAIVTVAGVGIPISIAVFSMGRAIPTWMGGEAEILADAAIYNRIIACGLMFRTMSTVLTALFRGFGDTKTPMVVNVAMNVVHVIINMLLIYETRTYSLFGLEFSMYGAGWGVAGAATSTAVSNILGAIALLLVTFLRKGPMQLPIKGNYKPDFAVLKSVMLISVPAAMERVTMSFANIITTRSIASLGTVAVAANSIALTAESISYMPGFAFGAAATTLVGQSLGAKRADLAEGYVKSCVKIASAFMAVITVLMYIFAANMVSIFTPDAEVIRLSAICLQLSATIQVPQVISSILSGGMRGAGDTKWTFIVMLISMWTVRIPLNLLFIRGMSLALPAAYVAMNTDICVRCIGFFLRYRTGKWKTVLGDDTPKTGPKPQAAKN